MRRLNSLVVIAIGLALIWFMRPDALRTSGGAGAGPELNAAPGMLVVDLLDGTSEREIEQFEARYGLELDYSTDSSQDEALVRGQVDDIAAAVAALESDPLVEAVEPVVEMEAMGFPNDPMWEQQWNMRMVQAPMGWRVGGGDGVKVAVIDTGVSRVEDLEGIGMTKGKSFVPFTRSPADDHGHGTHVAGTIAQATNNGKGVAGVAPGVVIMPYKALSKQGFGSSDWIASAIDQATDDGADIINMSLGGGYSKVIHNAVKKATAKGVVVVAAAGNSGREGVGYPGALKETVGVSAVGPDDSKAYYSSWGDGVQIAGPGGDTRKKAGGILQDTVDGKGGHAYRAFQGTSMATPHVAGAVAIMMGMGLDGDGAVDALYSSAVDLGEPGFDTTYGHGRLDVGTAVSAVLVKKQGLQFVIGGLMAIGLAILASLSLRRTIPVVLSAAITAGGLFFLPLLPLPPNFAVDLLSHDLLSWPAVLIGPDWVHFPLWASCLLPAALAFFAGPSRSLGLVVAGICVGFGTALLYGAAAGTVDPWGMSLGFDKLWLSLNGTACLLAGMAVVGMQKLKREAR